MQLKSDDQGGLSHWRVVYRFLWARGKIEEIECTVKKVCGISTMSILNLLKTSGT